MADDSNVFADLYSSPEPADTQTQPAPSASSSADLNGNVFADIYKDDESNAPSGALTAAQSFERGIVPAAGGLAGAGAGAVAGAAIGAPFGGIGAVPGAAIGAVVGGLAGGFGGSFVAEKAQEWGAQVLPDSWKDYLGGTQEQQELGAKYHPTESFLGGIAPYVLTMKPSFGGAVAGLPQNATALQRIAANPATSHIFGGLLMGGMELGNEAASGQPLDWRNIGISTGLGVIFNEPNRIGATLTGAGERGAEAVGIPRPANENVPREIAPVTSEPTVAQAGDAKVLGPGITEDVFMGSHQQAPEAQMTAQDAARTETSIIGPAPPGPDLHALARRMEPETFAQYDALSQQRDDLRAHIAALANPTDDAVAEATAQRDALQEQLDQHLEARGGYAGGPEARGLRAQVRDAQNQVDALAQRRQDFAAGEGADTPEMTTIRQHLMATDAAMRDLAPQVSAANRRAAERIGADVVESEAPNIPAEATTQVPEAPNAEANAPSGTPSTGPSVQEQAASIAADVARQLVAAGRPADEAQHLGTLIGQRYVTRSARLNGVLGSPQDLYNVEGAIIRSGEAPAPVAPAPKATRSRKGAASAAEVDPVATKTAADKAGVTNLVTQLLPTATDKEISDLIGRKLSEPQVAALRKGAGVETPELAQSTPTAPDGEMTRQALAEYLRNGGTVSGAGRDLFQSIPSGTDTPEFRRWFGDSKVVDEHGAPLVVYHGAKRSDRINEAGKFDRRRATSGPMAFFTDDPAIASGYATKKEDTSLPDETHLAERFLVKPDGYRGKARRVDQMWWALPAEERERIGKLAPRVQMDEEGQNVILGPETNKTGIGNYDYEVKQARGNHLQALAESWLSSGAIFDQEEKFLDVLREAGLTSKIEYHDPFKEAGGVFPVYLSINNPLDTSAIPQEAISALEQAAKGRRAPKYSTGKDLWDKTVQNPKEWIGRLRSDAIDGSAHAWTSIPDWATDALKQIGYDGIKDTGGKTGGQSHGVWIPFDETQVKSVANRGTFDPNDPRILFQPSGTTKRGSITNLEAGRRPIISLFKDADASTAIHEFGHQWLEELMRDAVHPAATDVLKDDAQTVRDWLGVKDIGEALKTRQHEKFARGFEQYMREGIAPSPGLARVFSQFKSWLSSIYQSIKGLGAPISDDIRQVFDRMIAESPQRTVMAPEAERGSGIASLHETEGATVAPHEAEPAMDRVIAERDRSIAELPPEVQNELATADAEQRAADAANAGGEAGAGADGQPEVVAPGGEPTAQPEGGGGGGERGPVVGGGGAPGDQGAGVAAGGRAAGGTEPNAGLRGNGPEPAGAARATATGNPLSPQPAEHFGPRESPLVDLAGNIRIDNLNTTADVANAIRLSAQENNDFIGERQGVVTRGQMVDLADTLGMDAAMLDERKIGQAFNASQIWAARKLLVSSATSLSKLARIAAEGSDEEVAAYANAKARHNLIQGQVAGITAEAGRALSLGFRKMEGQEAAQSVDQLLRQSHAKTLFQLKAEAKLMAALDGPAEVSKFARDSKQPDFWDGLLEYWTNALISNPATHATYAMGNEILALLKAGPETAVSAGIGAIQRRLGREGPTVHLEEVAAQLGAHFDSLPASLKAGAQSLAKGTTTLLPGEKPKNLPFQTPGVTADYATLDPAYQYRDILPDLLGSTRGILDGTLASGYLAKVAQGVDGAPAISFMPSRTGIIPNIAVRGVTVLPTGEAARLPGRAVGGIHSFFRATNYSMELNRIVTRQALEEGLTGTKLDARIAEMRQNPSDDMMKQARGVATDLTLMGQGSQFVQALSRLTNSRILGIPILKFIDPFVKISGNIIDQAVVQRTPVGLLSHELRADLSGANGNVAQSTAAARMLVGTALSVGFGALAAQGFITGSGPSDKNKAALWRMAGYQPHSVKIGDTWYSVGHLGPLGMLMGVAADMYDVAHAASEGDMLTAGAALQHAFTQNILDESFARGPSELLQAVEDPGRYGSSYIRNFASSFIPYSSALRQMDRMSDPYSRQARTIMDGIKSKVPGMSESLMPWRDIFGNPETNLPAFGGLTSIYMSQMQTDPVYGALLNLGVNISQPSKDIRGVRLTDAQYDQYQVLAGRMAKMRLDAIVGSQAWQTWTPDNRVEVVTETVRQAREAARGAMMSRFPSIASQAVRAKLAKFQGGQP